ncbi:SRPBCC family protein [Alsobacter sp. SYSU M60028]|uniref:SRPBCC family protein n=1 Tax=Alsobacter ponti TaxID=2962936 RepID=A0ABT1LH49_9HYPH|nr:SRPBCC family protein [Alsobacter ponti]MCP8940830.1 SRPBCC family protein [Alsobacter ponti]
MTLATLDDYGVLTEPATLTITRLLPGPLERCWTYLTKAELRRQWLAGGEMELRKGASFELIWRNDELSDPPGRRPEGFPEEHRLTCEITELEPPHLLGFTWGNTGGVSIRLEPRGDEVLLTLVHKRLPDRGTMLNVSAGWHMHLDLLVARARGDKPAPFWEGWARLKADYDRRLPA